MASHPLDIPAAAPPQINAVVDHYVDSLARDLPGRRGACAAAMDEVRDSLHEAIASHTARGLPPPEAASAAVAKFGSPATVAAALAPELATIQARRTLFALLITGPLVGVWWLLLLVPQTWPFRPVTLLAAIPVLPLIAVAVAAAAIILATTGSLIRWLPESTPYRALLAASAVALGCVLGDLTVLATLFARSLTTTWQPTLALAVVAVTGSLIRIPFAWRALLRCRRTLRLLTRIDHRGPISAGHPWTTADSRGTRPS